ncbi:MAG TPA: GAF domain-containing protein [Cyclobacteriaceae bacterium]
MISIPKSKTFIITITLTFVFVLLLANFVFSLRNYTILNENNALKIETEQTKQKTALILTVIMHEADLSVRGFGLTKNEVFLDPINHVLKKKDTIFSNIEAVLKKQQYDMTSYNEVKLAVEDYLKFSMDMIQLARQDSMKQFVKLLNEDRGYAVWKKNWAFSQPLFAHEDSLNAEANEKYLKTLSENRIIQFLLILLGGPTILYVIWKLRSDEKERGKLLATLDQSNRKYIFDTNVALTTKDWKEIIDDSIKNFQHANEFITKISSGDYTTEWNGLNEKNQSLNQVNLAGNLVRMRESLRQTKVEDERRNWSASGLAKFSEIIRRENDFQKLGDSIIQYVVNYTNSNQGGLFIVNDDNKNDVHLTMLSCYAWDKKKYVEKIIYEGQGVVGQCWQEGEPIFMTHVPADYINITSGLGQATPRSIFVAPLKVNDKIYGVLELASFEPYREYERQFILNICETIAAAISNTKVTVWTNHLLEQSQMQAEELRSREEEMRQNMEELMATQEGIERIAKESKDKELYMRNLIDASTDSIVTVDHQYKIIHHNKVAKAIYQSVGVDLNKEDNNILKLIPASEQIQVKYLLDKALSGEFAETTYEGERSSHYIVKYIPIKNEAGEVIAAVQFATDVTALMKAQRETKIMLQESQAQADKLREQEEQLRATMEEEAKRNKHLERANSQAEAQKQMMNKLIEKLKEKEKESQAQTDELRTQEEELRAQQEELRQNMEELQATLEAEAKRGKEIDRNNTQLEAQKQMMDKVIEKLKEKEKESQIQFSEFNLQREEFLQRMEEMETKLKNSDAQLEAQNQIMRTTLLKANLRENELLAELELREKYIANLTNTIRDN